MLQYGNRSGNSRSNIYRCTLDDTRSDDRSEVFPVGLQEACLIRHFVDHLAHSVLTPLSVGRRSVIPSSYYLSIIVYTH